MRFRPRSWPIAVKMSLDLLLAALVPLVLALWLTSQQSRWELEKSARTNLRLLAQVTSSRLDQLLQDTARTLQMLGRDASAVTLCQEGSAARPETKVAVDRQLHSVVATNSDFASILITNAAGIGVAGTDPGDVGADFNLRQYYRAARRGLPIVSEVIAGKTLQDAGVYFSAPVRSVQEADAGPILGTVVLKLRGESLWSMIDDVHVGLLGYAMLIDQYGVILGHPRRTLVFHSLAPLSADTLAAINPQTTYNLSTIPSLDVPELRAVLETLPPAGSVTFSAPLKEGSDQREPWVAGYARLEKKPWTVLVVQPQSQFAAGSDTVVGSDSLVRQQAIIGLVVAFAAGALALWRAGSLVRPVLAINKAARKLARGDFHARAEKFGEDEIGQLADAFNRMVPELHESVALQQSLSIAMEVQQSLLPAKDPTLARLDIAGRSKYCHATGGDYFDYIDVSQTPEETTLIAVGDVMGHGIASALVMASARAALRTQAVEDRRLSSLIGKVNRLLASDGHNRFMTLALVLIEPEKATVRWASAGHDPILLYQPESDSFRELAEGEMPLGLDVATVYHEHQFAGLKPGDVCLVATDGVWEMPNDSGERFGKDRLRQVLRENCREPAAAIAEALEQKLTDFRAAGKLVDDVTFVVVKVR